MLVLSHSCKERKQGARSEALLKHACDTIVKVEVGLDKMRKDSEVCKRIIWPSLWLWMIEVLAISSLLSHTSN